MSYHLFVQESDQGSGKLLDMLLLQMTLTRDAKREREREREMSGGAEREKKKSEISLEPPSAWCSLKIYCLQGSQSLPVISRRPRRLLTMFIPAGHTRLCVIYGRSQLSDLH